MKRYAFSMNTIEWVECPPKYISPEDPRVLKNTAGRFMRLRKWLFQKLSTPEVRPSYELRRATYSEENLRRLVSIAINKQRLRLSEVKCAIVSTETAFEIEEMLFDRSMTIGVPIADGKLYIHGFPVIVLPAYTGDEVLIVPKDA